MGSHTNSKESKTSIHKGLKKSSSTFNVLNVNSFCCSNNGSVFWGEEQENTNMPTTNNMK